MSAFAGLVHLDGPRWTSRASGPWPSRPPGNTVDALDVWHDGAVGLAHALARVTPEAAEERQPLVDAPSGCVIVFDGRLDNRAHLAATLAEYDRLLAGQSDAAYALAAYLRWDGDVARHLLGDFAFGVWDPRVRRLLLARDPVAGPAPLYAALPDGVAFASTLEQLLADPRLPRDLDESTVLWFLYDHASPRTGRSYYRDVRLVPGGHTLEVRPGHDPAHPVLELAGRAARAAVRERARRRGAARAAGGRRALPAPERAAGRGDAQRGPGLRLVACVAGLLHEKEGATPIRAYSVIFDRFASCDERRYSAACAARFGFAHTCVVADDFWTLSGFDRWRPVFSEPFFGVFDDTHFELLSRAQADGCRAVMTGMYGDNLFNGSPDYLSAWLVRGRLGALHAQARARARAKGRSYLLAVADGALRPLLPPALQARVLAARARRPTGARAVAAAAHRRAVPPDHAPPAALGPPRLVAQPARRPRRRGADAEQPPLGPDGTPVRARAEEPAGGRPARRVRPPGAPRRLLPRRRHQVAAPPEPPRRLAAPGA